MIQKLHELRIRATISSLSSTKSNEWRFEKAPFQVVIALALCFLLDGVPKRLAMACCGFALPLQCRFRPSGLSAGLQHIRDFVLRYIELNPCLYVEELQAELREKNASVSPSASTICRALRFDIRMVRKVPTKRAQEVSALERADYVAYLSPFYM